MWLTPVPRAPFSVMGIVSVRGQLVTVIDLRRRLRLPESGATRRSRVLLVNPQSAETLGLYVDEVLQVYRLAEDEIEHAAAALGGEVAPYISGIDSIRSRSSRSRSANRSPRPGWA